MKAEQELEESFLRKLHHEFLSYTTIKMAIYHLKEFFKTQAHMNHEAKTKPTNNPFMSSRCYTNFLTVPGQMTFLDHMANASPCVAF